MWVSGGAVLSIEVHGGALEKVQGANYQAKYDPFLCLEDK